MKRTLIVSILPSRSVNEKAHCVYFRESFENLTVLLDRLLAAADVDDLASAMATQISSEDISIQPTKRTKAGRGKGPRRPNHGHGLPMDSKVPIHEAYAMAHASIALAAEAAALGVVENGCTQAVVERASVLFVNLIQRVLMWCATNDGEGSDRCRAVASSAVAHLTRLYRHLVSKTGETPSSLERNLGTDLAQVAHDVSGVEESEMRQSAETHEEGSNEIATRALMRLLCQDTTGAAIEGARPHMTALIAALVKPRDGAAHAAHGQWMLPIAKALAAGIDTDAVLSRGSDISFQQDENANLDNARGEEPGLEKKRVLNLEVGDVLSAAVSTPVVKYVVASAKLVKGHERAAGTSEHAGR